MATEAPRMQRSNTAKEKTILDWIEDPSYRKRIQGLAPKHISAERLLMTFSQAVRRSPPDRDGVPQLMKVPQDRMLGAFMMCARLGLEPNSTPPQVHLVPFDVNKWNPRTKQREYQFTDVNVIIDYQGYVELGFRSGKIEYFHTAVVYEHDHWSFEFGTNHHLTHRPMKLIRGGRVERGDKIAAYAYAKIIGGGTPFEWMWAPDIEEIRDNSQGYRQAKRYYDEAVAKANGGPVKLPASWLKTPWVAHEDPMWRKTPFRALQKWLPKTAEMQMAVALDDNRMRFDKVFESSDRDVMEFDAEAYREDDEETGPEINGTAEEVKQDAGGPAQIEDRREEEMPQIQTGQREREAVPAQQAQAGNGGGGGASPGRRRSEPDDDDGGHMFRRR